MKNSIIVIIFLCSFTICSCNQHSKKEIIEFKVNEQISVSNFSYQIPRIFYSWFSGFRVLKTSKVGKFLCFTILIEHTGKKPELLSSESFALLDESGAEYKPINPVLHGYDELFDVEYAPHEKKEGYLTFDVPAEGIYYLLIMGDKVANIKAIPTE